MEATELDDAASADWYCDQPRSPEDIADLEADIASGPPPGRSFACDFRRRSITVVAWRTLKTKQKTNTTPPARSKPRAPRRTSRGEATLGPQDIGGGALDAEPPPAAAPLSRITSESGVRSVASAATVEVLALSDRERRLIDFLVDEALNEWWKQNSRD